MPCIDIYFISRVFDIYFISLCLRGGYSFHLLGVDAVSTRSDGGGDTLFRNIYRALPRQTPFQSSCRHDQQRACANLAAAPVLV